MYADLLPGTRLHIVMAIVGFEPDLDIRDKSLRDVRLSTWQR